MTTFRTVDEVIEANRKTEQDYFNKRFMREFSVRIETDLIKGKYFIESCLYGEERSYHIIRASDNGTVHVYESLKESINIKGLQTAKDLLDKILKSEEKENVQVH